MQDGAPIAMQQAAALRRKGELEVALQAAPDDADLRAAYFDHLQLLAADHTGLGHATLPELGHPLYFRGATPDVANMAQVFRDHALEVPMAATPRRILVLGAYAGYAAVWLARRHPLADIACVEPMPANLRLLALNTGPWPRIRVLGTAAWHSATRLAVGARLAGDWAPSLHDRAEEDERSLPARPGGGPARRVGLVAGRLRAVRCRGRRGSNICRPAGALAAPGGRGVGANLSGPGAQGRPDSGRLLPIRLLRPRQAGEVRPVRAPRAAARLSAGAAAAAADSRRTRARAAAAARPGAGALGVLHL